MDVNARQIEILGEDVDGMKRVLTPEAMAFIGKLHHWFNDTRLELLERRAERQKRLDAGERPTFLEETKSIRDDDSWRVAEAPADLQNRRVEITGPVERKMMINALNSGAKVFMADFEDANSPTWENCINGQINCMDAVRRTIEFTKADGSKTYTLNDEIATLLIRPRGWHLVEKHVLIDGQPVSASLFDFGLYFFHNAHELVERGSGPYFYLPKLESHREARLWNEVFLFAQHELDIPTGTIRATVLIETILAAFEMDEILYELREHSSGLNAGRWDYIFSAIKMFRTQKDLILPDRAQINMVVPFMRAYTELMVQTCHKRGAHAIGGMAAFIPNRREPEVTKNALAKVREDKGRESADGCDGSWVAHPDLVPVVMEIFDNLLGDKANQIDKQRPDVNVTAEELHNLVVPSGEITEAGMRLNINVALQYLNAWLLGNGAAAIYNLMEDTATAEISRAQLWQWVHNGAQLSDGRTMDKTYYETMRDEELEKLGGADQERYKEAVEILDTLVMADEFIEFLTLVAYDYLK